jgi:hypothetical protein
MSHVHPGPTACVIYSFHSFSYFETELGTFTRLCAAPVSLEESRAWVPS